MARPKQTRPQNVPVQQETKPEETKIVTGDFAVNDGSMTGPIYPKVETPKVEVKPEPTNIYDIKPNMHVVEPTPVVKPVVVAQYAFPKEYFETAKRNGLDYAHKGDWQKRYGKFLNVVFPMAGKVVVDLGCALGAITSSIADAGAASVIGVDISEHAKQVSPFKNFKFVNASFDNMKEIEDNSVDLIHSMMSFQYIPKDKVEDVLKEIKRIAKNDAIIFAVFPMSNDTHIDAGIEQLHPREFWNSVGGKLGFKDGSRAFFTKLSETVVDNFNFMKEYKWNYVVYKIVK